MLDLDASQRADRYVKFIEEIKERFEVIALLEESGSGGIHVLPEPFALESCYLQIRLICELIALACLVGHSPGLGNNVDPLTKTHKAHEIMRGLAALKADFFPKQLRWSVQNKGDGTADMMFETTEVLTAEDVITLHGQIGNILHRGRLSRILEAKEHPRSFQDVRVTCERLMNLLGRHAFMVAPDKFIWVEMFAQPENSVTWLELTVA